MTRRLVLCLAIASAASAQTPDSRPAAPPTPAAAISRIAFGSCARQNRPQPIWDAILEKRPELFLFTGDNIYGDTEDMAVMKAKWDELGAVPGFQKLRATCPIMATWDDHDYGVNDGGREYAQRAASQRVFLDFFGEPADSPRRQREGIYDAKVFGPPGQRVQVILLDTRYHRSALRKRAPDTQASRATGTWGPYEPNPDPAATMLGPEQWAWLAQQLRQPAEVRLVVSSIQVIAEEQGFEKWANLPLERERLFKLLAETQAAGVLFLSGDRHSAELSRIDPGVGYWLYDATSSALNQPRRFMNEHNRHRHGNMYFDTNFGLIEIDWRAADPTIMLTINDEKGTPVIEQSLTLSQLRRRPSDAGSAPSAATPR